jgi:hypothetical protein
MPTRNQTNPAALLGAEAFKREGYAEGWERLFTLFRDAADAG